MPVASWEPLASALGRFDGAAVAEVLASLGRFGEAGEAATIARPPEPVATRASGARVVREDSHEPQRFSPEPRDADRLLDLFGGCEGAYLRDAKIGERVERERVMRAAGAEQARAHLSGAYWLGVYPLRGNHTVRFGAVRVVVAGRARQGLGRAQLPEVVDVDARRVADAVRAHGLEPVHSVEPGRARVVWVLFAEAIAAARARTLLALVLDRAGSADPSITREVLPAQDSTRPDKPGTGVLLPLGLDPRTGERAWLCDDDLAPVIDPCAYLRSLKGAAAERVAAAVGITPKLPPLGAKPPPTSAPAPVKDAPRLALAKSPTAATTRPVEAAQIAGERAAAQIATETSPFRDLPRAQEVYAGCSVLRHYVDEAIAGRGMPTSVRILVAEILGRLGDESTPSLDAVLRHLDDWRPGLASRYLQRLYPHPTSCGRIRMRLPELTAKVGCDCRFRVPPGAYPTPVLHAVGAAEVPGLADRVRDSAERGGLARAAVAAMNEGRKELGAKASALCARLTDLRRQGRVIERTIASVESELDAVLDEAGDAPLETPSGTLRRVVEGGARRFVLDV
ncbi:MAG: hypothetical protein U0326_34935 [Polyangiales bacterium]